MIDATDFTIPGTGVLKNKLGITNPADLSRAAAASTALRLTELHATPIHGGFDSTHLQAIHDHIYQDSTIGPESCGQPMPAMCPRLRWRNSSTASWTA